MHLPISMDQCLRSILLAFLVSLSVQVNAAYLPVPIAIGSLNQNITTWTNGVVYNAMSGSPTLGGVPFTFQASATGMDVVWGTSISVFSTTSGTVYSNSVTLNTNLYGATKVYTLINTAWGTAGRTVGSVT